MLREITWCGKTDNPQQQCFVEIFCNVCTSCISEIIFDTTGHNLQIRISYVSRCGQFNTFVRDTNINIHMFTSKCTNSSLRAIQKLQWISKVNGLQLNNQNIEIHVAVLYPFMVSTEEAEEFLACSHYKIFLT